MLHFAIVGCVAPDNRADQPDVGQSVEGLAGDVPECFPPRSQSIEPARQSLRQSTESGAAGEAPHDFSELFGSMLRLTVANTHLLDEGNILQASIASGNRLHEWMLLCLGPGCRIYRQDYELALGNDGCEWMQELHPGGQGSCL